MARGKRTGGRKPGSKNKATIERGWPRGVRSQGLRRATVRVRRETTRCPCNCPATKGFLLRHFLLQPSTQAIRLTSPPSKGTVQYTGHRLGSVARSACDEWLTLFCRSRPYFLCGSQMRSRLCCAGYFLFCNFLSRTCRLLRANDDLARTANSFKIILLVDPSSLRRGGV